jgi:predicted DNA repair protein MutK
MASGLAALLDDIAGIAKIAASSLDDVTGAAGKASAKAAGVVVDDTAVTPTYAMGFTPDRELPIVWKIAKGSLRNKFLILVPGALAISAFIPWLLTPLLMVGGAFLCFEATEKIIESVFEHEHDEQLEDLALTSTELETQKVKGAIRTDLILSAEIVAISLGELSTQPLAIQAVALILVSVLITVGVYGVVGLIVKMDDIGLHLAQKPRTKRLGCALVKAMPWVLNSLGSIGTAAMLWVGGGIIVHGLEKYHLTPVPHWVEAGRHLAGAVPGIGGLTGWAAFALGSAAVGFVLGLVIVGVMHLIPRKNAAH